MSKFNNGNKSFKRKINQFYKMVNDIIMSGDIEDLSVVQNMVADFNIKIVNRLLGENKQAKIIKIEKKENMIRGDVAPGVKIKAFIIEDPAEAHNHRGFWCYHPDSSRYYLSINNKLVYSYVTNINAYNQQPIKFTEFDSNRGSSKSTNFYHPPEIYGGDDRRQITEKMCFVPASTSSNPKKSYIYRIGDRDTLGEDLVQASSSDIRLVRDVAAHWIMVGYLSARQETIRNRF